MDANVFAMAAVFGVIGLISLGLGLVMYIFLSLSLFTLAKRRGILHPGLAWCPCAAPAGSWAAWRINMSISPKARSNTSAGCSFGWRWGCMCCWACSSA